MPTVTFQFPDEREDVVVQVNDRCHFWKNNRWWGLREAARGATAAVVGEGVNTIGDVVFNGFSTLVSVTLPDGLQEIGTMAFRGTAVRDISFLPPGTTTIGAQAFENCKSLLDITLPSPVRRIEKHVFKGCTSLASVALAGVTTIERGAFRSCTSLLDINLAPEGGEGVTTVGEEAFVNCKKVKSITLSHKTTTIQEYAFSECASLETIDTMNVKSIEEGAFSHCRKLKRVNIRNRHARIDQTAFYESPVRYVNVHSSVVVRLRHEQWLVGRNVIVANVHIFADYKTKPAWKYVFPLCREEDVKWRGTFIKRYLDGYVDRASTLATVQSLRRSTNARDQPHTRLPHLPGEMVLGVLETAE